MELLQALQSALSWAAILLLLALAAAAFLLALNPPLRPTPPRCAACNYPIEGIARRACPECGHPLDSPRAVCEYAKQPPSLAKRFLLLAFATALTLILLRGPLIALVGLSRWTEHSVTLTGGALQHHALRADWTLGGKPSSRPSRLTLTLDPASQNQRATTTKRPARADDLESIELALAALNAPEPQRPQLAALILDLVMESRGGAARTIAPPPDAANIVGRSSVNNHATHAWLNVALAAATLLTLTLGSRQILASHRAFQLHLNQRDQHWRSHFASLAP
ncbi:MAG: hypothetical protein HRU70_09045 [Phycisphaeraceae bacterium]|nr:MAG: hypothetical protein HRU70_09045 [Phycisphaeraceae bacterium]